MNQAPLPQKHSSNSLNSCYKNNPSIPINKTKVIQTSTQLYVKWCYNTFKIMNISKTQTPTEKISSLLQAIAPSARLEILLSIGTEETCVCHLETKLGYRQAYISQHIMALRKAGVIESRRKGRFIYHRLKNQALLNLIQQAATLNGIDILDSPAMPEECRCPNCIS